MAASAGAERVRLGVRCTYLVGVGAGAIYMCVFCFLWGGQALIAGGWGAHSPRDPSRFALPQSPLQVPGPVLALRSPTDHVKPFWDQVICDYVFMCLPPALLRSPAVAVTPIRESSYCRTFWGSPVPSPHKLLCSEFEFVRRAMGSRLRCVLYHLRATFGLSCARTVLSVSHLWTKSRV